MTLGDRSLTEQTQNEIGVANNEVTSGSGIFCGIGVGPGLPGLLPLVAWEFLQGCDVIFVPRAKSSGESVARHCLPPHQIPEDRFREIEFAMESDRTRLASRYWQLAEEIAETLRSVKKVAYLTIGDPFTYSTYIYIFNALRDRFPDLEIRTYPGVTSYCAVAAATGFPLGEGKERVLLLPCPDEMAELGRMIELHDIVILLKIGERLPAVLALLDDLQISNYCAFGAYVGMENEVLSARVSDLSRVSSTGYLSTMLIRKQPAERRYAPIKL